VADIYTELETFGEPVPGEKLLVMHTAGVGMVIQP
jgi:hypothetical protein